MWHFSLIGFSITIKLSTVYFDINSADISLPRLIGILNDHGKKRKKGLRYIMWQEVMNNNLQVKAITFITVDFGI